MIMRVFLSLTIALIFFIGAFSFYFSYESCAEVEKGLNSYKYFYVPLGDLLNTFIVGMVVYYFVEYKNDSRVTKSNIERICNKMISRLEDERMCNINSAENMDFVRIEQRKIFNEIDIIGSKSDIFSYKQEIDYVKEQFDQYWILVSDNFGDYGSLCSKKRDLRSKLANCINKLEIISMKIYK